MMNISVPPFRVVSLQAAREAITAREVFNVVSVVTSLVKGHGLDDLFECPSDVHNIRPQLNWNGIWASKKAEEEQQSVVAALEFTKQAWDNDLPVLFHCTNGTVRSPNFAFAMVAAYMGVEAMKAAVAVPQDAIPATFEGHSLLLAIYHHGRSPDLLEPIYSYLPDSVKPSLEPFIY